MLKITGRNIKHNGEHFDYELKNGPLLHLREWNGEDYTVGKVVYTPVYRFQNENIDLDALEENSLEWIKATEVIGFEEGQ